MSTAAGWARRSASASTVPPRIRSGRSGSPAPDASPAPRASGGGPSSTRSWTGGAEIRPAARSRASWYCACSLRSSSTAPFGVLPLPARLALRELLLELAGVEEDQPGQLAGALRRDDPAAIALVHDVRDQSAVVEVGVGQEHDVERARVVGERHAIPHRLVRAALEHPAVDQDAGAAGLEEVLRAGDGGRATEEVEVHPRSVPAGPLRHLLPGPRRDRGDVADGAIRPAGSRGTGARRGRGRRPGWRPWPRRTRRSGGSPPRGSRRAGTPGRSTRRRG